MLGMAHFGMSIMRIQERSLDVTAYFRVVGVMYDTSLEIAYA